MEKTKKKKIYFIAPLSQGGTYYYYEQISSFLQTNYGGDYDVIFVSSLWGYLQAHFQKADVIFSIVPMLWKPLRAKKYIFNLHGNYQIERKSKGRGVKLLYLTELNLRYADKIMLTSYYLADKLGFREKYEKKIIIIPNYVDLHKIENNRKSILKKINSKNEINLLTISNANFIEKGMGVYDLAKEIYKIKDISIYWTIVLPGQAHNKENILERISTLEKGSNITVQVFDFIDKNKLSLFYKSCDIFVYASGLETWGGVIMEACSYGKPVILLPHETRTYIFPEKFVTNNIKQKMLHIIQNYSIYTQESYDFVEGYDLKKIIHQILVII